MWRAVVFDIFHVPHIVTQWHRKLSTAAFAIVACPISAFKGGRDGAKHFKPHGKLTSKPKIILFLTGGGGHFKPPH